MITNGLSKQRLTLSREAEQSVLGGLMLSNHFWKEIKALLAIEDFALPEHRLLFASFEKLDTQGQPWDPVTCSYHLEQEGTLATIGGNSYLRLLMEHTPSTANLITYAQIVKECALNRYLIERELAARQAFDAGDDALHDTLTQEISELKTVLSQFKQNTPKKSLFENLEQSFTEVAAMKFEPVQWIVQDILPTGVSMLLAKPKQGKSWLALDLAIAVATGTHHALGCKSTFPGEVLYFALEDNQRRMNTRINKLILNYFEPVPHRAKLITGRNIPRLSQGFEVELDRYLHNRPHTRLVVVDPFTFIEPPPQTSTTDAFLSRRLRRHSTTH